MLNVVHDVSADHLPRKTLGFRYQFIEPVLVAADLAILVLSGIIGDFGYQLLLGQPWGDINVYAGLGLVCGTCYAAIAHYLDLYSLPRLLKRRDAYWRVLGAWILAVLFLTVIIFMLKIGNEISRGAIISFCFLSGAALVAWQHVVKSGLQTAISNGIVRGRRTLLVGSADELSQLSADLLLRLYGIEEIDRYVLGRGNSGLQLNFSAAREVPVRARQCRAEQIILALQWEAHGQIGSLRNILRLSPLPVRLLPDSRIRSVLKPSAAASSLLIDIQRSPLTRFELLIKRIFDIVCSSLCLIILAPLMLLCAVIIKLESRGPVIFRQRRNGFNNHPFLIYKFRTMSVTEDGAVIIQARRKDPRVTNFGRILRRTSIDELPQLFNVLKGDMSIVGPRPHAIAHDDEYGKLIADYAFRGHVKPGITGWAQVNGFRGGTQRLEQMNKRVEYDLWYINNWSILLDLQIMLRTAGQLINSDNAY